MTFDVIGRIDECFLLSYAVDAEQASSLLPPGLEAVTHRGVAFLNIVVSHIARMRPRFTPRAFGVTYWHIAYRLHVRATLSGGAPLEGLYFLRSDVDRPLLGAIGNHLTPFRFHAAHVRFRPDAGRWSLRIDDPHGREWATMCAHRSLSDALPPGSPFLSLEERERFLKYAPLGLSVSPSGSHLRIVEVRRDEASWKEEPIAVDTADWSYPRLLGFRDPALVRATRVRPIEYTWRIGRVEALRDRSAGKKAPRASVLT